MKIMPQVSVGIFVAALLLSGCNSKDLTRSKAKELIQSSSMMAPAKPAFNVDQAKLNCGAEKGLWTINFYPPAGPTPANAAYVSDISLYRNGATITFGKSMERVVDDVTGMTDAGNPHAKVVNFTWHWKIDSFQQYPEAMVKCIGALSAPPTSAQAVLVLYDDGWRVEK